MSFSTACMTAAAIGSIQEKHRGEAAIDQERHRLEQNIQDRLGGRPRERPANNPASIREALLLALPIQRYSSPRPAPDSVEVSVATLAGGRLVYRVTASADFNAIYNRVFLEYADNLRRKLRPEPVFELTLVSIGGGYQFPSPMVVLK